MTANAIEMRAYRPEDREVVLSLLAYGRPEGYRKAKAAIFDWQFHGNPSSAGTSPFVIGTLGDEIVAIHGSMPVSIRCDGKPMTASWGLDMFVSDKYRGRGFGKAVVAEVSKRAPIMLGFGNSDMSDQILANARWDRDHSMVTLFFHANEVGLKGFAKNLLTRGRRSFHAVKPRSFFDIKAEPAVSIDELDSLWARVVPHFPYGVERSGAYLTWRYRNAPGQHYRWFTARRAGQLCAALVTRHHAIESVIADYVGPLDDPSLLRSLVEAAVSDLVASKTRRVRCDTTSSAMLEALAASGFIRHRTASQFRVRWNMPHDETSKGKWFVMTGDSDNDFLVL